MPTITLTKENFWKKVSFLYGKIISTGKVRITLDEPKEKKGLVWTQYEQDSFESGMNDLENWETVAIDFNKIKTADDFISFIKS